MPGLCGQIIYVYPDGMELKAGLQLCFPPAYCNAVIIPSMVHPVMMTFSKHALLSSIYLYI